MSSEFVPSKKMFSWRSVLVWNGESKFESFWCVAESGRRSFISTSINGGSLSEFDAPIMRTTRI